MFCVSRGLWFCLSFVRIWAFSCCVRVVPLFMSFVVSLCLFFVSFLELSSSDSRSRREHEGSRMLREAVPGRLRGALERNIHSTKSARSTEEVNDD